MSPSFFFKSPFSFLFWCCFMHLFPFCFCPHRVPLFKCTSRTGDEFIADAKYLVTYFGPAGCIDTELMDLVISYWKGSPDYNHVYKSGDRVLLSPYVINVR